MKKNQDENSMSRRTTSVNLNQGSNERMRKTQRSICDKGIQKCTSLYGNSMQVRDRLDRMARNPEKEIINLDQLVRSDPRIRTPLNRSTSKIWHNVIEWRGLIIQKNRMLYLKYPKSRGHYYRSNGILFTPYPTLHTLSVRIIRMDRKVWVELSDLGSRRRMINIHQRQLAPTLKVSPNVQVKLTRLAIQLVHSLNSRLSQVAKPNRHPALFWKNWLFALQTHTSINTPHTHEILRASRENIERETLEKNKIHSSTIYT